MNSTPTDTDCVETCASQSRSLMADLSITRHGRYYHFAGYRYELLSDAIAYARLIRERSSQAIQRHQLPLSEEFDAVEALSAADKQVMEELSISFENYSFVFEGFRYDRLSDAVNYAQRRRQVASTAL